MGSEVLNMTERFSRKDGLKLHHNLLSSMLDVQVSALKDEEKGREVFKLYVFTRSSDKRVGGIKKFEMSQSYDAIELYITKCMKKSKELFVALGAEYTGGLSRDLIIVGDTYPDRTDIYNKVVRKVLVGVVKPDFCDQRYLRDRDAVVPLYIGETDQDAINLWCTEMKNWIRADEKYLVKVIKEVGLKEYAGSEVHRHE